MDLATLRSLVIWTIAILLEGRRHITLQCVERDLRGERGGVFNILFQKVWL